MIIFKTIRGVAVFDRLTGEVMTLEEAIRKTFEELYNDPEVAAEFKELFSNIPRDE